MTEPLRHVALNALFLDPGASGGPETYLRELVPALAAEAPGVRFTVLTTRSGARALAADGFASRCTLVGLAAEEGERGRRLWAEQVVAPVQARRRGAQVLHSLASIAPLATGGVRSVVTIHDVTFFRMRTFNAVTTLGMKALMVGAARRADALIAPSAAGADDMAPVLGIDRSRVAVVPHGAGRLSGVVPSAEADVRARFGLEGARVVLNVASKRPHKNQGLLLRAAGGLPDDVVVVLAGHPEPYDAELRALAASLGVEGRVRFADYVEDPDLEALWRLASAAAFPTRAEGFGIPVVEAMQRGVPVACSDLDVLREVGGDVPRYFSCDDPADAASAITAVLDDDERRERGRSRAARFSWAEAARGTLEAYERALAP